MAVSGLKPFDIQYPSFVPYHGDLPGHCPYRRHSAFNLGVGEVLNSHNKYTVVLDVTHFKPGEVRVILAGNELTIYGNHDEKNDLHGHVKRSFVRKFIFPKDANLDALRSSISDDGHLTIEAPKKIPGVTQIKAIPITRG